MNLQPTNFKLEDTTVWSFPTRGSWATHTGNYRGNWSPYIPRNLILKYSNPGEWVLDQFMGSGTTLVEAKLLNRNAYGIDINSQAVSMARKNLEFRCNRKSNIYTKIGDASNMNFIMDNSFDLICMHPPYSDIIKYSQGIEGDLSLMSTEKFLKKMDDVAAEAYRVLKTGKKCAIMMGDIRKKGKVIPLGFKTMERFLSSGFVLEEIIIKEQHNCRSTSYWETRKKSFLLLAHEYIFVFQK